MEDYREPIYKIEPWNITEEEFLLKIIIEMKQHFHWLMDI